MFVSMKVTLVAPSPRLQPFVRAFTFVETEEEATRTLIPECGIITGFRYAGHATELDLEPGRRELPDAAFTGMRSSARVMRTSAGGGIVLAMFREGGAAQFFAEPLHELFGATVALDELAPRTEVERTRERIGVARNYGERAALFEEFLLARLRTTDPDPLVGAAVRALQRARGAIRIRELAADFEIGQDRLEKRFRKAIGATPKQLASILRLRHVVESYRPGTSLAALALDAGYFDQSHLIREFRAAMGQSPQRFFRAGEHC